ncbi:tetratricopeptide repeat protein [Legionella impletisoli]|uniref:Enhanced entry protein EnhC n=1 Tax=Legionella impletisoli TaxID=343510 RepID=A0A917JWX9_9GAMM|nr:tetratricopeptide repeat protein [Legionella impletisoli]GGI85973.1 enhanced entry protein EnhC [Legionella impletisoli]
MKSVMPWVCLIAAGLQGAYANTGVEAYRQGNFAKAAEALSKDSGSDPVIEYYKGRMRLYGYGLLKNNALALKHLTLAAEKGYLPAQNILAHYELLTENNPEKALYWFKKAADSDDLKAQMYCAAAYMFGYGTKPNSSMARRYYIAAAKNNNSIAQYTLAEYFLDSRNAHNRKLGLIWLNKAAEQGNYQALLKQGELYAEGKLVSKNTDEARKLIEEAVKQGSVLALYQMGTLEQQLGNLEKAKEWYTKAAEKNNAFAQIALAKLYLIKDGPFYDPNSGFLWMLKAAQNNAVEAQRELAKMYKDGIGVLPDENLAKEWQEKSKKPKKKTTLEARDEVARWLSNDKSNDFAASGYTLKGIQSPWNNTRALQDNNYNPAPQLAEVTREQLYKPQFVLTNPNDIKISEYYNALASSLNPLAKDKLILPQYPIDKLEAFEPEEPLIPNSPLNTVGFHEIGYYPKPGVSGDFDLMAFMSETEFSPSSSEKTPFERILGKAILGVPDAQFKLGQLYEHGIAVNQNYQKALEFYQLAAEQKDLRAEYNIGLMYLEGKGVERNYQEAESWLKDAAFKGNTMAQYALARIKEQGFHDETGKIVIERDPTESVAMYYIASSNDYGPAQYRLAEILVREKQADVSVAAVKKRNQTIKKLYHGAVQEGVKEASLPLAFFNAMDTNAEKQQEAYAVAKKYAEEGNTEAALLVGLMLDRGVGVAKNPSEAIYWYQKTTMTPVGSFIMGTYLNQGQHISQDVATSKKLLQHSADSGFSYGNLNLAVVKERDGQAFLDELNAARTLGNSTAGLLMADYYLSLGNDPKKMQQARDIYQEFAEKGDKEAQLKLAFMHEEGLGGEVDVTTAQQWYTKASTQGQPVAQYLLGRMYFLGKVDNKPNYEEATHLMKQALTTYSPAAVALGFIHDTVFDNYQLALASYQQATNQNNPIGYYNLGLIYELGKGVPVDFNKAQALYLKAAEKNNAEAMVQLAGLYFNGLNGPRDERTALHWYQKAADLGNREALYQLGLMSETGVAKALDSSAAMRFYQQAADKGNTKAMLALARMYQYGQGITKDNKKAIEIYEQLAKLNNPYAQFQLATFYYDGALGEQQTKKGKELLMKAQKNGYKQAGNVLQWLDAQAEERLSYIEPVNVNQSSEIAGQPVELMYFEAMNEWNRGDEELSRMILNKILQRFPHYTPAKRAYDQLHQNFSPKHFS